MQIYNKEKLGMRKLPRLDVFSQDDIIVEGELAFIVSTLKEFLKNLKLQLSDDDN
jgi:hypothetical protein